MQLTRFHRNQMCTFICSIIFSILMITAAIANQVTITVDVNPVGDAEYKVDWPLAGNYSSLKSSTNPLYLARTLNDVTAWHGVNELTGEFVDSSRAFKASMSQVGYARTVKPGKWQIDMDGDEMSLVTIADGVAHFSSAMAAGGEATNVIARIVLPEGSSNIRFNKSRQLLTFDHVPVAEDGDKGELELELSTKDEVMSSLAKVYSEESFDGFWVARTRVKNTGNQMIKHLRLRHRVSGLSSWSSWKKHSIIYPGQTVIEPFFPVFDVEELADFTDARTAMVEVEYRYEMGGERVTDSDSQKIKILARNQALWASRPPEDRLDWTDQFDNSPMVISAFCNSNDPVVQEIGGVVSRLNRGIPQTSDQGAIGFLQKFWRFLEVNRVAYQSPAAGADAFDRNLQHVKYPRDVMRNRAGTCVDLAIMWASVAKAVGLQSYVMVIPGHAFPVIRLPSGELFPIESTLILHRDFETAHRQGLQTFRIADGQITTDEDGQPLANAGKYIDIDVNAMQSSGVHCLDLPTVQDGYLMRLGYKIDLPPAPKPTPSTNVNVDPNQQRIDASLVGTWSCNTTQGVATITLAANHTFEFKGEGTDTIKGNWSADASKITTSVGDVIPFKFLQNGTLELTLSEKPFIFTRVDNRGPANRTPVQRVSPVVGTWGFALNIQGAAMKGVQRFGADGSYESALVVVQNGQETVVEEQGTYADRGTFFEFKTNEGNYRQNYKVSQGKLTMEFPDLNTWIQFSRMPTTQGAVASLGSAVTTTQWPASILGKWTSDTDYYRMTITFKPKGAYRSLIQDLDRKSGAITSQKSSFGSWFGDEKHVTITTPSNGGNRKAKYKFDSGKLVLDMDGNVHTFTRAK